MPGKNREQRAVDTFTCPTCQARPAAKENVGRGNPARREKMTNEIKTGMRVEAGAIGTEDHDSGKVIQLAGDMATVAWDSGVRTTVAAADLRAAQVQPRTRGLIDA